MLHKLRMMDKKKLASVYSNEIKSQEAHKDDSGEDFIWVIVDEWIEAH